MILLPAPPIASFPANPTLLLTSPPYWPRRRDNSAVVSAASRDVDSFTSKSGYLFNLSADEADSLSEYNFPRIDAMYKKKPLILLRRLAQIGTTFGFWFGLRLADEALDRSEQMFKAYVKIAQAVSSRPDLIPPIYLDELSLLQDQITPFSTEVAFSMIEDELGLPIDELFSEISPEPVAAASLGQVYQARLRRSGEVVAVKVQRPGVRAAIALDTLILRYLAGLIKKAGRFNSDLQVTKLYGSIKDVLVPKMYTEYSTSKVLVMEWVEGQKLAEVNDLYLVEVGVYCSFNQLLEYGFYHADPHPGNFLRTYDGQLAYLDFGMMGDFRPELRDGFMEACLHLVNRDFKSLAKDFVTLGYQFKFRIPPYFSLVIRSLAVLEGIAIGINPNYKVLGSTYPWIARKILTDSSPQLKSSLQSLLYEDGVFRIDRLESLVTESLRTETALVQKPVEGADSKIVMKQILAFTFTEQGSFVREILLREFAKGLDAYGLATLDSFTSTTMPFSSSRPFNSLTEEDMINLRTFYRLISLFSGVRGAETQVKAISKGGEALTPLEEASLVMYQLPSAEEMLPILSILPELPQESQQRLLQLPGDLVGRLVSRAFARTIRRMFL
uniref:Protein kinase domain-containing protein n=1 Tax=Brassica campestris TaxID=3711 RepID=M4DHY7_BRACM